jgi:hypothetical protein
VAVNFDEVERASLDTAVFERYLDTHGWMLDAETRAGGRQWRRESDSILLPAPESPDHSLRLYDAVLLLARAELRDPRVVLGAVANAAQRTIAIRVVGGSTAGGVIALSDAVQLIGAATALMTVAVQRTLARRDAEVDPAAYLREVLLGQTLVGSFGLTVFLPQSGPIDEEVTAAIESEVVESVLMAESLVEVEPRFVRRERDLTDEQFAELTTSFVDLLADDESRVVEVEAFDEQVAGARQRAALSGSWLPRLRLARDQALRELQSEAAISAPAAEVAVFEDVTLRGRVVALRRPWVTIEADTPVGRRQVRFRLREAPYRDAVTAHREDQTVMIRGLLQVRPRSAELRVVEFGTGESSI